MHVRKMRVRVREGLVPMRMRVRFLAIPLEVVLVAVVLVVNV